MSWYIDSWSVADGLAFMSRRGTLEHLSAGQKEELPGLESNETIYVCPPYFEPEKVGGLGTALGGIRGSFQAGFSTDEKSGVEHEFRSLGDAVELVKRVYRASGGDDFQPPVEPYSFNPDSGPPDLHRGAEQLRELAASFKSERGLEPQDVELPKRARAQEILLECVSGEGTRGAIGNLAWESCLRGDEADQYPHLVEHDLVWRRLLRETNLRRSNPDSTDRSSAKYASGKRRRVGGDSKSGKLSTLERGSPQERFRLTIAETYNLLGLVHVRAQGDGDLWHDHRPSFLDTLKLCSASHSYVESDLGAAQLMALLTASVLLSTAWLQTGKFTRPNHDRLWEEATVWLASILPLRRLDPSIENLILEYAIKRTRIHPHSGQRRDAYR